MTPTWFDEHWLKQDFLDANNIEHLRLLHSTSSTTTKILDWSSLKALKFGQDISHVLVSGTATAIYNRYRGLSTAMSIKLELGKGRLKGGRYFTLFLYPPPRGDYFVIYDEHQNEVHRFPIYLPIKQVHELTTNPEAPSFVMTPLSGFMEIAHFLGFHPDDL